MLARAALPYLWAVRWSARRVGFALVHHEVVDAPRPVPEIVPSLSRAELDAQLAFLTRHLQVVPASDLVAAVGGRRRGERLPVAITFDDDLTSHVEQAVPALRRAGVPATFFLDGMADEPRPYWWRRLQRLVDDGRLADACRALELDPASPLARVVAECESRGPDAARALTAAMPDADDGLLTAQQIKELAAAADVGLHPRGHARMTSLADDGLDGALDAARLRSLTAQPITSVAYPHGAADQRVAAAARRAGFTAGFTTEGVAVRDGDDPLLLPRITVGAATGAQLALLLVRGLRAAR